MLDGRCVATRTRACVGMLIAKLTNFVSSAQEANPLPDYEVLPLAGMPELELDMQLDGSWWAGGQPFAGGSTFWTLPTPFAI